MKRLLSALALLGSVVIGAPLMAADVLPQDVADTLAFMREEEKLAHDVYLHFSLLYAEQEAPSMIFTNITASEQRHTDAVKELLDKYALDDPAADMGLGEFENEDLQTLYNGLVSTGEEGFEEALGVGVVIEQKDMADISDAITLSAAYADIVKVYTNLLLGSERHLSSFLKVLDTLTAEPPSVRSDGNTTRGNPNR